MSTAHRVVVTGMGALSPLGRGVDALWSGLLAGRSGIRRLESLDLTGQEVDFGGQVPNFDPSDILEAKQIKRLDRFSHLAIAASVEALTSAGLPARLSDELALGTATIIGSGLGGATTLFEQALTGPNDGPCALTWIATSPAAMLPIAPGIKNGETRPAPFSA